MTCRALNSPQAIPRRAIPRFCWHLRLPLCRPNGDAAEQKPDLIEPDAGGCRLKGRVDASGNRARKAQGG